MINGHKVIGVCVTVVHNRAEADYIDHLRQAAHKRGCKVMVFNSVLDFYVNNTYAEGAKSVYELINYDIIDALVIIADTMYHCKDLRAEIIERAQKHNVPVVLIDDKADGCFTVEKRCNKALTAMVDHIIRDHGVTDTFFIAGRRTEDPYSETRIQCYKDALAMNGIEFSEDRLDYGEYWAVPTNAVMERMLEGGKKPPKAIICANDYMAIAVCEYLKPLGYNVPNDVIVTGFGGVSDAEYFNPRLTTCRDDMDSMAELTVDIIFKALDEHIPCDTFVQEMEPVIAESCGCHNGNHYHSDAGQLFNTTRQMKSHEAHIFNWLDKMIDCSELASLYKMLSKCILANSTLCLKDSFLAEENGMLYASVDYTNDQHFTVIPSIADIVGEIETFNTVSIKDLLPNLRDWVNDDTCCILTAVYVGSEVCGYYAVNTNDVYDIGHKINRTCKGINIALNAAYNLQRQKEMAASIENADFVNPVTKLPNIKGVTKWFNEFAADEENRKKKLAVSIYGIPRYKYIYDNFGLKDIEEALRFVADALTNVNTVDCFIGQVAEDEFVVVNYFDPNAVTEDGSDYSGEVINAAVKGFFELNEHFNSSSNKEYFVEVNCGCTISEPGWDTNLEAYIKLASNEMYLNRIRYGTLPASKDKASPRENYEKFKLLISNNMFHYNFQPIVDAKTGEIYAYEALMRTDPSIGMNPLEVLETAEEYNRLYDVEKATMFNIMERYVADVDKFKDRKVFINSIPGHFLKKNDDDKTGDYFDFCEKYRSYLSNVVLEITEQDTISDDELYRMKHIGGNASSQIAIDDYGTGHSNIVNLLRYAPQVIKIDRYLITDIHKNANKQMFVKSTIDLAKHNNIKVLAEGVETSQELRTVISYGVDFIQGFYTGKPAPDPIDAIDERIRYEIQTTAQQD